MKIMQVPTLQRLCGIIGKHGEQMVFLFYAYIYLEAATHE